jgi:hypothetical protein
MKGVAVRATWLFCTALVLAACSSSDSSTSDEVDAVPFSDTRVLSSADLAMLDGADPSGTLSFRELPAALANVDRGSVIVASISDKTPAGLLRIVKQVDRMDDGSVQLQTLNAPIQLAFRKLHVRVARTTELFPSNTRAARQGLTVQSLTGPGGQASKTETFDYPLFDGDDDPETDDDRVELSGQIGGTVDYQFGMDFDWGAFEHLPQTVSDCVDKLLSGDFDCSLDSLLPEAKVSFTTDTTLSADARLKGAAVMSFERTFPVLPAQVLAEIPLGIIVLAPVVEIEGKIEGGASGHFETGISASATIDTGVDLSSKRLGSPSYHGPDLEDVKFDADKPSISLQANARAEVTARVNLLLYDVVGPSASASVYAEVQADPFADPCYALNAGIEADLGITVEPTLPILGSVKLFDWHAPTWNPFQAPIVEGTCAPPPMPSQLPPGSGADAEHYAMPAFDRWSKLVSAPIDGSVAVSPTDEAASVDLQRSIDGRYLVADRSGQALSKLDESGAVTWAQSYRLAGDDRRFKVIATAAALDADLYVLAQDPVSSELRLLKLDQSGAPRSASALQLTADVACTPVPRAIVADAANGAWIAGSCMESHVLWLFHATPALEPERPALLATTDQASIALTALAASDGEPVLGGRFTATDGDEMFVTRFDARGAMTYAKSYVGCSDSHDLAPRAAVSGDNGDVTFVGSGGGNHNGFVTRLRRDGSVGFSSFPGVSFGVSDVLALQSVAELATTGYVVAGSTVDLLGDVHTMTPAIALLGLDAVGKVRWAARYALLEPDGSARASGFPGLKLTDDGGVYVAGLAAPSGDDAGALWAFKAFAKDGSIDLDPTHAQRVSLTASDLDCAIEASDLALDQEPLSITARSIDIEVDKLDLTTTTLTP